MDTESMSFFFFSFHQKVEFIYDDQIITWQSTKDISPLNLVLEINHSDDDLFLANFTFDEIQTIKIKDFRFYGLTI